MHRAHKIRMYPNKAQETQLRKTVGAARYAYNWALEKWKTMYEAFDNGESTEKPSANKLSALWTEEKPGWATETARVSQQRAIFDVGAAFQNMWRGNAGYPKFHKKGHRDSFYVDNSKAYVRGNRVHLPRIGSVRMAEELRFTGDNMSYTVSQYAGQWHVSIQVDVEEPTSPATSPPDTVVGVDVGLASIATTSDGTVIKVPESLDRLEVKLKGRQRALARSQKNSRNHQKLLIKKQRVQNRINNIRKDAVHKFTAAVAKSHGTVVTESLDIRGMMKSAEAKSLRRTLSSSMMSEVIRQISYKAAKHVKVDRFFPSSKRCSGCGSVKERLALSERTYVCEECGLVIDRDLNASINLMQAGLVKPEVPVESLASRGH